MKLLPSLLLLALACAAPSTHAQPDREGDEYAIIRAPLAHSAATFNKGKSACVAFLGGSITYNPGWRDMVCDDLRKRFPQTDFEFIAAGIPSMGSTCHAFRLRRDVFAHGSVDLLFVEAAVNDATNARSPVEMTRGMEGVVRQTKLLQPDADIVMLHFVDPAKMNAYNAGITPTVITQHERVAEHYRVTSLNLAKEVTDRISAGEFTWEGDFRDLHPSPFGQRLYFNSITRLLDRAWSSETAQSREAEGELPAPLDPASYFGGDLVPITDTWLEAPWRIDPKWRPTDGVTTRMGFVDVPMLIADEPGPPAELSFEGRAVGAWVVAGPDAGKIEHQVDDRPWRALPLATRWSHQLHLPWVYLFDTELKPGPHTLRVRLMSPGRSGRASAVRIVSWVVNR